MKQEKALIALKTSEPIKALIKDAADYLGQNMTAFVVGAAVKAARQVLGHEQRLPVQVATKDKH